MLHGESLLQFGTASELEHNLTGIQLAMKRQKGGLCLCYGISNHNNAGQAWHQAVGANDLEHVTQERKGICLRLDGETV